MLKILNYAKGGIGNQLFQHVFALSLAGQLQADMLTDISYFGFDPYGFNAAIWNLDPQGRTSTVVEHVGAGCYMLKEGQISSLQQIQALPVDAHTLVLDGYWQGEAYFQADIARETYIQLQAKAETLVDPELIRCISGCRNAVAVHVRRRDYAHMGLCKESYYIAAIQHIRLNYPDAELFVFSDEPNFTRHLFGCQEIQFTLVASGSDLGDLYLMSLCRHFVISNSSYSWWAAWFGEPNGGLIFCPKEWVTINATPSPCPARWVQVPNSIDSFFVDPDSIRIHQSQIEKLTKRN